MAQQAQQVRCVPALVQLHAALARAGLLRWCVQAALRAATQTPAWQIPRGHPHLPRY